jgi:hypothetical protein
MVDAYETGSQKMGHALMKARMELDLDLAGHSC